MKRSFLLLGPLTLAFFFACGGSDTKTDDGGNGGEGGSSTGGSASECPKVGKGTIEVKVSGLPEDVSAKVKVVSALGAASLTDSSTLSDKAAGPVEISAERVLDFDPIVRGLYEPTIAVSEACLEDGKVLELEVVYSLVPTSNKLWTPHGNGDGAFLGFPSSNLAESGEPADKIALTMGGGIDVAFDKDGNLWAFGATLAETHLLRFPRETLGTSGEKTPDREININGVECIPAMRAMAFSPDGDLFVSVCGGEIVVLKQDQLEASGSVDPSLVFGGLEDQGDIAFDAGGNLWIADANKLLEWSASGLETSGNPTAEVTITARDPEDTADLGVTNLAFDEDGNLWVVDFGANAVYQIESTSLATSDAVPAKVRVTLGVTGLLDRPAFDEGGGLWIALSSGKLGRLSPAQLGVSSDAGSPTTPEVILESETIAYTGRMAFFPAPAKLPLYHALDE